MTAADPPSVLAGLCSVTFRQLPAEEVVDVAAGAGLEAVEWGADVHLPPGDEAAAARLAERCREAGLATPTYGSYHFLGRSDPGDLDAVLATALGLGARTVRVWCERKVVPASPAEDKARVVEALAGAAERAAARDLTLSLEFHPGTLTETAESTLWLLGQVGHPAVFTYWQPAPGAAADEARSEHALVRHDRSHLHVFWWERDGSRLPLSGGAALWRPLLAAERRGEDGRRWPEPVVAYLEFVAGDDPARLREDAATLLSWLGRGGSDG